jgi:hypothetical protein
MSDDPLEIERRGVFRWLGSDDVEITHSCRVEGRILELERAGFIGRRGPQSFAADPMPIGGVQFESDLEQSSSHVGKAVSQIVDEGWPAELGLIMMEACGQR